MDDHESVLEHAKCLRALADRLERESCDWEPLDLTEFPAHTGAANRERGRRQTFLWEMTVRFGVHLFELGCHGALVHHPRLQTRIFQIRSDLLAAVSKGKIPLHYHVSSPVPGLDQFLALVFTESCRLWPKPKASATSETPKPWRGERRTAVTYARVVREIAGDLEARFAGVAESPHEVAASGE